MISTKTYSNEFINHLSDTEKKWFAINTKFRCEKFVANQLQKKNIEAYLPVIKKTKRYLRKIKNYEVPLINSFIFVNINKEQYIPTLETEYVFKFLKQGKDLISIPEEEIQILKRVAGDCIVAEISDPNTLSSGDEVEVVLGPLTGMRGIVINKAGKKSFHVELKTIGYSLKVKVDLSLLKPIHTLELSL